MEQKTTRQIHKSGVSQSGNSDSERTLFDTVGDELKRARIAQKLSVEVIAERLKIKSCYITALEQNDYAQFPALAYGIGFLRTYARFLGLDVQALVERFKTETMHLQTVSADMPIPNYHNVLPSKRVIGICLAVLLGFWGAWYWWGQSMKREISVLPNNSIVTLPVIVTDPVVTAPIESDTILNQDVEALAGELNAVIPVEEESPVSNTAFNASDAGDASDEISSEVSETAIIKHPRVTGKKYGHPEDAALVFVATERVWVEIKKDNQVVFERILSKGDGYFVPLEQTDAIMRTGNARGLDVYVNGVLQGKLSDSETVKKNILLNASFFEKQ